MKPATKNGDIANFTPKQVSAYYLELGRLLDLLEKPCTHYQALNIERSANLNQIKQAYAQLIDRLYAPYSISSTMPPDLQAKIELTYHRVTHAFLVLANFAKRMQYDRQTSPSGNLGVSSSIPVNGAASKTEPPAPTAEKAAYSTTPPSGDPSIPASSRASASSKTTPPTPSTSTSSPPSTSPSTSPSAGASSANGAKARSSALKLAEQGKTPMAQHTGAVPLPRISSQLKNQSVYSAGTAELTDDRRRVSRIKLTVPARITGHERIGGKWNEMATTVDVSRTGLTVLMRHRVRPGLLLYLTLPLPEKLRNHGHADAGYAVYCLVRRVDPMKKGARNVGLEFVGPTPPPGFLEKPWATFKAINWGGSNRRRKPRKSQTEIVVVEYYDESMRALGREMAKTENLSTGGMQISVRTAPAEFELLRILCPSRNFESFAALRSRFRGKDGFERLCIQFNDNEWKD
ncbi:MAG: hypothetical protein DMF61_11945 [Blastocatellia bacterium AA13]|nr:MAG: hypothetical protein DMF61_11945 [Blastocatellia bacterium AA13]